MLCSKRMVSKNAPTGYFILCTSQMTIELTSTLNRGQYSVKKKSVCKMLNFVCLKSRLEEIDV